MQLDQSLAQTADSRCRRFNYQQPLRCRLDLASPAIYGLNLRNDVYAGRQLPLDQCVGDAAGFFERAASRENEPGVGHNQVVV